MIYANPIVGRTGLCNMLFIWARALVFARESGATMLAPRWTNFFRLGPFLRFERNKRYYMNEFINKGYVRGIRKAFVNFTHNHLPESEASHAKDGDVVDFKGWSWDHFKNFVKHHGYINEALAAIVNPTMVAAADAVGNIPFIGVHIRRGDFVTNGQAVPDGWYVDAIARAREIADELPVKIFSDCAPEKLVGITSVVKDCHVMPKAPAVQDLLALSKCKCLVATSRSTFSMWAVFLGQMPSIWSVDESVPGMYVEDSAAIILKGG